MHFFVWFMRLLPDLPCKIQNELTQIVPLYFLYLSIIKTLHLMVSHIVWFRPGTRSHRHPMAHWPCHGAMARFSSCRIRKAAGSRAPPWRWPGATRRWPCSTTSCTWWVERPRIHRDIRRHWWMWRPWVGSSDLCCGLIPSYSELTPPDPKSCV